MRWAHPRRGLLAPRGRLVNHGISRPAHTRKKTHGRFAPRMLGWGFTDRYVFPDGELTGSGRIITEMQDVGLEVRHEENLREHYAMTCRAWARNLAAHWDECVAEAGEAKFPTYASTMRRLSTPRARSTDSSARTVCSDSRMWSAFW